MGKVALFVLTMVLAASLASADNFCCITREEATDVFGDPAGKQVNGPYEHWTYKWEDTFDDEFDFKNGKLVAIRRWACTPTGRRLRIVESNICDDCE